jgi:hypothetical protein
MSARTSGATAGRPGPFPRLFQVHKILKPDRCQRMTVAGWTTEIRPAGPQAGQHNPEQAVGGSQPRTWHSALEDDQLEPQGEVLEHEGALGPDTTEEGCED